MKTSEQTAHYLKEGILALPKPSLKVGYSCYFSNPYPKL